MDRDPSHVPTEIATTVHPIGATVSPPLSGSDAALAEGYKAHLPGEPSALALPVGARLGERYEIIGKLGQGGMGVVYEARNTNVEHIRYAIKTLLPGRPTGDTVHFLQEAKRASKVRSPHVVQIFDFGTDAATGLVYMVMDYIGEDLEKYTVHRGGTLQPAQAIEFCAQTCEALAAAHDEGLVHRDIKPHNCLLRVESGRETVVVSDFGVAREFHPVLLTQDASGANSAWTAVGTPGYVAPEIWLREGKADHRVDIYGVGAMLFKLLVGRPPPLAPRPKELRESGIPDVLLPILSTAMARAPKDRYPSAKAMQAALRAVLPSFGAPTVPKTSRRGVSKLILSTVVLAVAAVAVLGALYLKLSGRQTEPPVSTEPKTQLLIADAPTPLPEPRDAAPESTAISDDTREASLATITPPPVNTSPPDSKDPAVKPRPPLPTFPEKEADLAKTLKAFCSSKHGVLACTDKLALKKSGRYEKAPLEIKLWFRFGAKSHLPTLESRDARLDLTREIAFKRCVESRLRIPPWRLPATRGGGELSCPVAL